MMHLRLRTELTLIGPILTQTTTAGAFGIDAAISRTTDGRPYLPYTLVRGKLRQALEELHDAGVLQSLKGAPSVTALFGARSSADDDPTSDGARGLLWLDDFIHPQPRIEDPDCLLTRIKIDEQTGTVEERMMQVIDTPFGYGEPAVFVGDLRYVCADPSAVDATTQCLQAGLRWMAQLGADRTIGFGQVQSANITDIVVTDLSSVAARHTINITLSTARTHRNTVAPATPDAAATRYSLRLIPRAPLCIGGRRVRDNVFESETVIPGNVLLGALATMYCAATGLAPKSNTVSVQTGKPWQALARNFGSIRITHAFPAIVPDTPLPSGMPRVRPSQWPLSLVAPEPSAGDPPDSPPKELMDVALCTTPTQVEFQGKPRPPVFTADWKSFGPLENAHRAFGFAELSKELRIRTAIDTGTLRAADEQLFAYEHVDPARHEWLAWLDLSAIIGEVERAQVLADIRELTTAGIEPLGKTKVDAAIEIGDASDVASKVISSQLPIQDLWVVTLQTAAILCSPSDIGHGHRELLEGYRRVFLELSDHTLELQRFFASQSLSNTRFASGLPQRGGHYYPFIVTDAGSTFVLKGQGDMTKAQATIDDWLEHGIKVADSLMAELGSTTRQQDWQRCPILNRHGFGEVMVNPPWLLTAAGSDAPVTVTAGVAL